MELTEVRRQNDQRFIDILQNIRKGRSVYTYCKHCFFFAKEK